MSWVRLVALTSKGWIERATASPRREVISRSLCSGSAGKVGMVGEVGRCDSKASTVPTRQGPGLDARIGGRPRLSRSATIEGG